MPKTNCKNKCKNFVLCKPPVIPPPVVTTSITSAAGFTGPTELITSSTTPIPITWTGLLLPVTFPSTAAPRLSISTTNSLTTYNVLPSGLVTLYTQGEIFTITPRNSGTITVQLVYTQTSNGNKTILSIASVPPSSPTLTLAASTQQVTGPGTITVLATNADDNDITLTGSLPITASTNVSCNPLAPSCNTINFFKDTPTVIKPSCGC